MPRQGGDKRPSSDLRRRMRQRLHTEQQGRCFWCEQELTLDCMQMDRVRPGKFGGTYRFDNVVGACDPCNKRRGNADKMRTKREAQSLWTPTLRNLRSQRRSTATVSGTL